MSDLDLISGAMLFAIMLGCGVVVLILGAVVIERFMLAIFILADGVRYMAILGIFAAAVAGRALDILPDFIVDITAVIVGRAYQHFDCLCVLTSFTH